MRPLRDDFAALVGREADCGLARGALEIARIAYPALEPSQYLTKLDELAEGTRARMAGGLPPEAVARAVGDHLFRTCGFRGNAEDYYDPRNSFLNDVLDRRTGIPISLAVVYMEVARRAGLQVEGVNFPGHFLVRCQGLIIDAFHGGAILSEDACRVLLRRHEGEDATLEPHLSGHASKRQILARMLVNLKQVYVQMNSFPQARDITALLLAIDPTATHELRDRGLIAYHLNDFSSALRDLQAYLDLSPAKPADDEERKDYARILEHVKTLRRRVATFN